MADAVEEIDKHETFLELISTGVGPINAGYHVGWTPAKTRALLGDPEFAELVDIAEERLVEGIEQSLHAKALAGNMRAIEMVLYAKHADRGWRPPTQRHAHQVEGRVDAVIVESVKAANKALVSTTAIAELQGPIDDAEIVDDD